MNWKLITQQDGVELWHGSLPREPEFTAWKIKDPQRTPEEWPFWHETEARAFFSARIDALRENRPPG
jgi:hypothetical protein